MNKNRMQTYRIRKAVQKKTNEGSSYTEYGDPFPIQAEIWPASGRIQAEMYGERLTYILNMICEPMDIKENDGVCVYDSAEDQPDYRIIAIHHYLDKQFPHMECELEKIR